MVALLNPDVDADLRTPSSIKLLRKEKDLYKFDLKNAQYCAQEPLELTTHSCQAQVKRLQKLLDLACQEIVSYESLSNNVQKNIDIKKGKRARKIKIKKSHYDDKTQRETRNLVKKLNKVYKANKESYKNLIREFKNLIKIEQDRVLKKKPTQLPEKQFSLLPRPNLECQKIKVENQDWLEILPQEPPKFDEKTETSGSDEEIDSADSSGSDDELSSVKDDKSMMMPATFLRELENQLFKTEKTKKVQKKRRKLQNNRFKKLKNKLDQLIIQRIDDFVKINVEDVEDQEFDFCEVSDGFEKEKSISTLTHEKFNHALKIIKQKKFKLKKTKRFVEDIEGVKVQTHSAYSSALQKIFERRKYFDIDEEDSDENMLDI